jgi:hypothetical protein
MKMSATNQQMMKMMMMGMKVSKRVLSKSMTFYTNRYPQMVAREVTRRVPMKMRVSAIPWSTPKRITFRAMRLKALRALGQNPLPVNPISMKACLLRSLTSLSKH